jgi:glutamyl-Q tRNA(Asp) synthetase
MNYVGRFAPSPSGPLHFGSLIAALGSYFQAKSQHGTWLVRIEDLDPPREMRGASDIILKALEAYGLHWDGDVVYQSQRHHLYQAQVTQWLSTGQAYYCECSRKRIKENGGHYTGTCRNKSLSLSSSAPLAIRLRMSHPIEHFYDERHGEIQIPTIFAQEDFIIKRRDGLFAYNLAVVIDDIDQKITQVTRGADLIEVTGRQISLYHMMGQKPPLYLHLPLAMEQEGRKLSKQNHATAINILNPRPTLALAMRFLGFQLPNEFESLSVHEMLDWGCNKWHISQLPQETEIIL